MKMFERKGISPGTLYLSKGRAHLQQRLQGTLRCSAFIPWGPGYGLPGPPQDLVHLCPSAEGGLWATGTAPHPCPPGFAGPHPRLCAPLLPGFFWERVLQVSSRFTELFTGPSSHP